nr:hypothetical protein [Amycolatopsis sp. DSM 110486]
MPHQQRGLHGEREARDEIAGRVLRSHDELFDLGDDVGQHRCLDRQLRKPRAERRAPVVVVQAL